MSIQNSTIVWSFVLIILTCSVNIEAAKATRRGGTKSKSPNPDHYALSYGGSSHGNRNTHHQPVHHQPVQHQPVHHQPVQHQPVQHQPVKQQQAHQQLSPSAPALPTSNNNDNKPIGWNVPHTAEKSKTISNTQSGLPYPNNPPPYTPNAGHNYPQAGPPPPYSQNPNTGFQSHVPAGPPPPYTQNGGFHSSVPVGQPPAYQPNGYPMHNSAGSNYPQGQYTGQNAYNPSGAPAGIVPNNQPTPVINNFYGQPQSGGGSSGGGFLQTALAAGAGSLAGNALYGALKPNSDKTVIIHENAASSNVAASAPAATNAAPAGESTTAVVPVPANQPIAQQPTVQHPTDPQTTMQQPPPTDVRTAMGTDTTMPLATNVPLAPLPEVTNQSNVPLAPLPDSTHIVPTNNETSVAPNQTVTSSTTNVPLAPFPSTVPTDPSAHAQQGSATTFAIFNISVYTIISLIIANVF